MQGFNGHGMAHFQDSTTIYWDERRRYLAPFIGKLGDTVSFSTLPSVLQTPEMARAFGARLRPPDRTHEVCGSPGEVASDPSKNHRYEMYRGLTRAIGVNNVWDQGREERYRPYRHDDRAAKNIVWSSIAMHQDDQLRGRVAWALSQILVTSEQTTSFRSSETWAAWYDLFTRHAFGNYKDLLREVSYSPIMGEYLTYVNNKALAVTGSAADENYAREIKQLFTVGLWTLNNDGSRQRDAAGNPVPSYTTAHIMSYARAWTGFTRAQFRRGNVEDSQEVDPMYVERYHGLTYHLGEVYFMNGGLLPPQAHRGLA
jgi:cullin-associated NEDD8-dissociated protein 1